MMPIQLRGSVGLSGNNYKDDIKAVQRAMNQLSPQLKLSKPLTIDGSLGRRPENSHTVAAIKFFQKHWVGLHQPDGRIDRLGRSHRKLNELLNKSTETNATATGLPLSATLKQQLKIKLEEYEGRVPFMYLDTKGNVTVGIGHLLATAEHAKALPFISKVTAQPADSQQITDEFNLVKSQFLSRNQGIKRFKAITMLCISNATIDELTEKYITSFTRDLISIYGSHFFLTIPDPVKLALYDMIFNLGMWGLKNEWPKFNRHIINRDWKSAAVECQRNEVPPNRNQYVKQLLANTQGI